MEGREGTAAVDAEQCETMEERRSTMLRALFSPIRLGTVEVPNRVALSPMGLGFETPDEIWSERYFPFIEERCRGETGLIISHFTNATPLATAPLVGSYDDRFLDTHRRLAEVVHRYDSKLFLQIAAMGGKGGDAGPSAVASPNYLAPPRELAIEEIQLIVRHFAQAAARARQAGCDGVEVHGGHDYLIGAFMSPHLNRRQDEYGRDFTGRMRFPIEIVRAIRQEVGEDFPIGFKFSAWEEVEGGVDLELGARIAQRMAQEGLCYLHVSATSTELVRTSQYPSLPSIYGSRNALLPLAAGVKRVVGDVPVLAVGGISDPDEANEMIARGDCDMVVLGRALLAEPHWARRARLGERVRPCIRCDVCYQALWTPHTSVCCTVNPHLTLEAQAPLPPIAKEKKVMVAGGGPGGIVAALTAARRGHQVTLYETEAGLGGELIPGGRPPFKAEIRRLLEYWKGELADSGVEVNLNSEVTPDLVRQEKPDALLVAVGASPVMPLIPGIDGPHVMSAVQAFLRSGELKGKRIVVLGGGDVGCECAVFLAQQGCEVTIVELLDELLLTEDVLWIKLELTRMLQEAGVQAITGTQVTEIGEGRVVLRSGDGTERSLSADFVLVAVGMSPRREMAHQLAGECADVRLIGDCREPRRIRDAVVEGDLAARLI
jgi:2,4-dienoyl-CoA reductase-like NADH-dependent reductase (Old Yellow Enzyme family)/NADPH-dependent 2,4-dienoyl-CoA reductase/sulfur reductase-like enzyme